MEQERSAAWVAIDEEDEDNGSQFNHDLTIHSKPTISQQVQCCANESEVGYKKESGKPVLFKSEDLKSFTTNFDDKNLIGPTQFGKVYRGMIPHGFAGGIRSGEVTVKIWDEKSHILWLRDDECIMVNEEVTFLTDPSVNHHQNLVKLIGYCCDGQLKGVVYDLKPLDTLHNMATRDGLTWVQMIKVAHGFAQLLEFLHGQENPCVVFNVDPLHIMLDQDCNPILFDFGLLSGGIIEWNFAKKFVHMSPPYVDRCYAVGGPGPAPFCDVYVYGIILLGLITKRIVDKKITRTHGYLLADKWAKKNYTPKCSLVHTSLEKQQGYYDCDGPIITELGMRCVEFYPEDRPTMKEVVACLERLQSVQLQCYADESEVGYKKDSGKPVLFKSEDLKSFTTNFVVKNLIGPTQFGKVYRGMIPDGFAGGIRSGEVTVKIWDENSHILWLRDDECITVNEEVMFLTDPSVNHHQNLVKLIGYCCDGELKGVVYDLKPLDTLHNMATRDGLTWVQMIKVAHGFAQLLEFLHGQENPCVVFNVDPLHIMLDQDCNPILFDFGLLSGGIIEWNFAKKFVHMSPPYVDSCYAVGGPGPAPFCDVYAYGIILLGLITKRIVDMKITRTRGYVLADDWAKKKYTPKCSLVHTSLEKQQGYYDCDGPIITELGMRCVEFYPEDRPTMKEVVACLERLQSVQHCDT